MNKSVYYYKPLPKDDTAVKQALQQKSKERPEEGFWKAYERMHRVYVSLGLPLRIMDLVNYHQ